MSAATQAIQALLDDCAQANDSYADGVRAGLSDALREVQRTESGGLTPHEAKCLRIALAFGDPAAVDLPDDDLEAAKAKLLAIEANG